jgi:anti-sigma B factor antagonist
MQLSERQVGTIAVLDVSGTITQSDAEVLRTRLAAILDCGRRQIVLDLADVTHLDSAALGGLVASQIRATKTGTMLKIANSGKRLRDMLVVTRLTNVFDSYDSLNAALASFEEHPSQSGAG